MKQEQRTACFDETLGIEAYRFIGIMQKFLHQHLMQYAVEKSPARIKCKQNSHLFTACFPSVFDPT